MGVKISGKFNVNTISGTGPNAQEWSQEYYEEVLISIPEWVRTPDWIDIPSITPGEEIMYGVFGVYDQPSNFVALKVDTENYHVNWGDGVSENVNGSTQAEHNYDYTTCGGSLSTDGFKTVLVTITPQSTYNLTNLNVNVQHSTTTTKGVVNWLEIAVNSTLMTSLVVKSINVINTIQGVYIYENIISSFSSFFANSYNLQKVVMDTSNGTTFYDMFSECVSLKTIPWIDTTNSISGMNSMFNNCVSLITIPLISLSGATSVSNIFTGCNSLVTIPFLDTSEVTTTSGMFRYCYNLKAIPLLDISSVLSVSGMFSFCYQLEVMPALDFGVVTTVAELFNNCSALKSVPDLDTSNVTNFSSMFSGCRSLEVAPTLDITKSTNCTSMFRYCHKISSVTLLGDPTVCLNYSYMYKDCYCLTEIPNINYGAGTNMSYMFQGCNSLKTITATIDTSSNLNFNYMFDGCKSLTSVLTLDISSATSMSYMFQNCYALQYIPDMGANSNAVFSRPFNSCYSLEVIPSLDVSLAPHFSFFFYNMTAIIKSGLYGGIKSIDYSNCSLSSTELDNIYTNLGIAVSQTITVTGNYGVTGDDPTIATAKGWTVTG